MGTSTAVLQYPWSHLRLVDWAKRVPALQADQKTQSEPEQHCAREEEEERVKGKSQVRASETTITSSVCYIKRSLGSCMRRAVLVGCFGEGGGGS